MRKLWGLLLMLPLLLRACGGTPALANSNEDQWYEINDFSGGLKSHVSPYLLQKNSFSDALNVRINSQYGTMAKRPKMLLISSCHAAPVKSIYRFYKSDATKFILANSSTFIDYVNENTGACTNLLAQQSDGKRWSWETYKDEAIGTNGTDRPIKWDGFLTTTPDTIGSRTAGDLVTQLGAAFAQLAAGTDLQAAKWYQYKVAYYDGEVYKFSDARSNPLLTGATVHDISLSDIPLGPTGTTSRIIYRTLGQTTRSAVVSDTTFYQVATIANNIDSTYTDTAADATISGDATPTWATVSDESTTIDATPPAARFVHIHQERLFMANDLTGITSGKSTVYWSDVFNPDYFNTATDYELIRPDDGDEITVMTDVNNILTIGKTNTWSKIYTDGASTDAWTVSDPFDYFGCVAPYSAANGVGGVYYLSRFGLRTFNGQTSSLISDTVTDKVRDIQPTNLNEVVGVYQDNQYQLAYTSISSGSAINDSVLVLDLTRNAYVRDSKNIDSFAIFTSGTDTGTLVSGSSALDGGIYAHSGSFSTLVDRYKSDLDAGTFTNTQSNGDEDSASLSLGSNATWASDNGTWASDNSTWLVEASPGTWVSPIIQINASKLDKIYWNENLGSFGNVTFAVRSGDTTPDTSSASWSSEVTTPSGSDISGTTANNYIQLRATLSTSNFTETPYVFLDDSYIIKLTYTKTGTTGESSILSYGQTGLTDMDVPHRPKRIQEIQVHYTGTAGTLNMGLTNDENTVNLTFPIDLSVDPTASRTDQYYGDKTDKVYVYIPSAFENPTGRRFRFSWSENGTTEWQIKSVDVRFTANDYVTYK